VTSHSPTEITYGKSPMDHDLYSSCFHCDSNIIRSTWYDDDCGWRTDKWAVITWVPGVSEGVTVSRAEYECKE